MRLQKQDKQQGRRNHSRQSSLSLQSEDDSDHLLLAKIIAARMRDFDEEVAEPIQDDAIPKEDDKSNRSETKSKPVAVIGPRRRTLATFRNSELFASTSSMDSCILKAIAARSQECGEARLEPANDGPAEALPAQRSSDDKRPGAYRLAPGLELCATSPIELPSSVAALHRKNRDGAVEKVSCNSRAELIEDVPDETTTTVSVNLTERRNDEERRRQPTHHRYRAERGRGEANSRDVHTKVAYAMVAFFALIAVLALVVLFTKPSFLYRNCYSNGDPKNLPLPNTTEASFLSATEALDALHESLSKETGRFSLQEQTPEAVAYQWLANDTSLAQYPLWRIQQRFAIATLYESKKVNHLMYDASECDWSQIHGDSSVTVTCFASTGELQKLEINNPKISVLPWGIAMISSLESLVVTSPTTSEASLAAFLPSELAALSRLTQLEVTRASAFEAGPIPTFLGSMTQLTSLQLSGVQLTGSVSRELGQLTNLESLVLFDNSLTGTADSIIQLPQLKTLWIDDNILSGSLPRKPSNSLDSIHLGHNRFSGTLPEEWGSQLTQLLELRLASNEGLIGTIPETWGSMTDLKVLDLDGLTSVGGTIPSSFCSRSARDRLSFSVDCDLIVCCEKYRHWIHDLIL